MMKQMNSAEWKVKMSQPSLYRQKDILDSYAHSVFLSKYARAVENTNLQKEYCRLMEEARRIPMGLLTFGDVEFLQEKPDYFIGLDFYNKDRINRLRNLVEFVNAVKEKEKL